MKIFWKSEVFVLICICWIQRSTANCILSMKNDLTINQPLIISPITGLWRSLDSSNTGFLELTKDENVKLICPQSVDHQNDFAKFPGKTEIQAKCKQGNNFEVDSKTYSFDQLQCSTAAKPITQKTGTPCMSGQTELIKVGFNSGNNFVPVYEVCFDKDQRTTIFAEEELSPNYAKNDAPLRESTWENDNSIDSKNLDREYTCEGQTETFHRILGKNYFKPGEKCCFAKASLVPAKDMTYGSQQVATYHYLNSVPQWSTCNNRANWVEVENRVRTLASHLRRPLRVWTGGFRVVKLRNSWIISTSDMYLHFNSKNDKALKIPLYIWKVVHDPQTRASLAIIQINKPGLTLSELDSYTLCRDICYNVNWMNFLRRDNIGSGYTYCCDLNDFIFGFQMQNSNLPKNAGKLLTDDTGASWNSKLSTN